MEVQVFLVADFFLVVDFFPFIPFNGSCHSLLGCRVSAEKSTDNFREIPFYVICCSSHCCFQYFLFTFNLCQFDEYMFQLIPPRIYLVWDCLYFLDLSDLFFSLVREVFDCDLFRYLLRPFIFFFLFWDSYSSNVGVFNVVSEFSNTLFIFFFSLFCSTVQISIILSSRLLVHFSVSVVLLQIPLVHFSFCYCLVHLCLFLILPDLC